MTKEKNLNQRENMALKKSLIELPLRIGSTMISPKDGMVMLYVPAGPFLMGSADSDSEAYEREKPQRLVYLDGYWIDQTPITNRMFTKFVTETGYQTQAEKEGYGCKAEDKWGGYGWHWQHPNGPKSNLSAKWDHPVVWVTWHDAQAYCQWAERRLPTEAEWEKAARGTDGRIYPWGNAKPNDKLLNFNDHIGDTTPVGGFNPAGASPYGALDMAGNVWEFTADYFDADYYKNAPLRNPQGPVTCERQIRASRGGAWDDSIVQGVRAGDRAWIDVTKRTDISGFRCVVSV